MDRAAWNELADDFEESVCDVTADETTDQLRRFVMASRPSPEKSVLVDLGCGIGSFIQKYGRRFKEIVAVEYASKTMARARERCAAIEGIEWISMDVARASKRIGPRADLTVCMNVITSSNAAVRSAQWASVASVTRPGGFALIVVPSLESEEMVQAHSRRAGGVKASLTDDGLVEFEGRAQKFYRRDEVTSLVSKQGLDVVRIGRVLSPWSKTGLEKPRSAGSQNPWDWICLARRPA